jgi:hypothetical protein
LIYLSGHKNQPIEIWRIMSALRPPSPTTTVTTTQPDDLASITSLSAFEQKYEVEVENGLVSLVERVNKKVIATLQTPLEDQLCRDYGPTHFHNGNYYYAFGSSKWKSRFVYRFDLKERLIKHVLDRAHDPKFIDNLLVDFGTGFNVPGPQTRHLCKQAVITIYDLNRPDGNRKVKTLKTPDCRPGGFDGTIDEESRVIEAFDWELGNTCRFRIDDILKS